MQKDSSCHELVFILEGEIASSTSSADASYNFTEYFSAPYLIELYSVFGMNTSYASTHRVNTEIHTANINKALMMKELFSYGIFRLNYMNMASNRTQMLHNRLWKMAGNNLEACISHLILSHVGRPSGKKVLKIKMEDLAQVVSKTCAGISKAPNNTQDRELIGPCCGEVVIPDTENPTLT